MLSIPMWATHSYLLNFEPKYKRHHTTPTPHKRKPLMQIEKKGSFIFRPFLRTLHGTGACAGSHKKRPQAHTLIRRGDSFILIRLPKKCNNLILKLINWNWETLTQGHKVGFPLAKVSHKTDYLITMEFCMVSELCGFGFKVDFCLYLVCVYSGEH